MANSNDYAKLSTFVGGILDRKLRAVSQALITVVSVVRGITAQASTFASNAQASAVQAATYAAVATQAAQAAQAAGAPYLGILPSDPAVNTNTGGPLQVGNYYIRSTDAQMRAVMAIDNTGKVTWNNIA